VGKNMKKTNNYSQAIQAIKNVILKSRYRAAVLANKELLSLYYWIGKYISENSRDKVWGTGAIKTISEKLQQELPGLRGFSAPNIKKMRIFFEQWCEYIENRSPAANEISLSLITINRSLAANDLTTEQINTFFSVGFTHHYEIISKTKSLEERLF